MVYSAINVQFGATEYKLTLLDAPTALTFSNSSFCHNAVFTCFVFISQQTETYVLYSINCSDFINEVKSVYGAVRTESLNKAF